LRDDGTYVSSNGIGTAVARVKGGTVFSRSFVILCVTLVSGASSMALANSRPGVRGRPSAETVLRAETLRRLYRPETRLELDRMIEAAGAGDKARIREFLEGKGTALTEAELQGLSEVYRRYQAKGAETQSALVRTLGGIDAQRLVELKRSVPAEFHDGLSSVTVQRLALLETHKASGMSRVSLTGLPEAVRGELVGENGPWERYLRANPEAKLADREAALTDLANLVDRAQKDFAAETDREARTLIMDLARIAAAEISVLREVSAIAPRLRSRADGADVAKTLDGLRTALLAAQYARSSDRASARAELAAQLARGDRDRAKTLEDALERAEKRDDPGTLREARERFKDLVENEEALSQARTLAELVAALERRIGEETGDVLHSLRELRDFVEAKRLILALNEIAAFRRMSAENKVAAATCVLRSAGLRSAQAMAGATSGLMFVLGLSAPQFDGLAARVGGFRVPDKLLTTSEPATARSSGRGGGGDAVAVGGR
jgi:hypothetical protein